MEVSSRFDHTITDYPKGTGVLAFRDLEQILSNHVNGKLVLDLGCDTGRSSHILKSFGYEVTGVDVCNEMIDKAQASRDGMKYHLITSDNLMLENNKYNLILLSFVLMEISTTTQIIGTFARLKRFLAANEKIAIINTADDFYCSEWLSTSTEYGSAEKLEIGRLLSFVWLIMTLTLKITTGRRNAVTSALQRQG